MEQEKVIETQDGKFLIKPYEDEDKQKLLKLWSIAFKKDLDPLVWEWKFHNNPFGRKIMICWAPDGNPVVMYASIPFKMNYLGKDFLAGHIIDIMSHPDYRQYITGKKRLFVLTAEHFFNIYGGANICDFYYGFPGIKSFKIGQLMLNYQIISKGGKYLSAKNNSLKTKICFSTGQVKKVEKTSVDIKNLWENIKQHYPIAIKRSFDFINWRFINHPFNSYHIYTYTNIFGEIQGYLVVLINDNIASIIDVLTAEKSSILCKLLQYAKNDLKVAGINKWQVWISSNHFLIHFLRQMGFNEEPEPLGIIPSGRSFNSNVNFSKVSNKIFYTMADADLF